MDEAPFEIVRRGYDPEQVRAHVEGLQYDLRIALADQRLSSARVDELMEQVGRFRSKSESLREQLDREALAPLTMDTLSDKMQRVVELARAESDRILAAAHADAESARAAASAEGDRLRAETATECSRMRAEAEAEITLTRDSLAQAEARLAEERAAFHAEQEKTRADLAQEIAARLADADREIAEQASAAAAARAEQDEDFELAIGQRRAAACAQLRDEQDQSVERARRRDRLSADHASVVIASAEEAGRRIVATADQRARQRIEAGETELHRTQDVRAQIVRQMQELQTQLQTISAEVARSVDGLAPLVAESPAPTLSAVSDEDTTPAWHAPSPPQELVGLLDMPSGDGDEHPEE